VVAFNGRSIVTTGAPGVGESDAADIAWAMAYAGVEVYRRMAGTASLSGRHVLKVVAFCAALVASSAVAEVLRIGNPTRVKELVVCALWTWWTTFWNWTLTSLLRTSSVWQGLTILWCVAAMGERIIAMALTAGRFRYNITAVNSRSGSIGYEVIGVIQISRCNIGNSTDLHSDTPLGDGS